MTSLRTASLFILAVLLCSTACDEPAGPVPSEGCEWYADRSESGILPALMTDGKLSCDGNMLAYIVGLGGPSPKLLLLDLQTGEQRVFGPLLLPKHIVPAMYLSFQWCPYDPDLIGVDAVTWTDTSGNGIYNARGVNSFITDLEGNIVRRVTPDSVSEFGNYIYYFSTPWLEESSPERDLIQRNNEIYIPQENRVIPSDKNIYAQSRDGDHWYGVINWNDQFEVNKLNGYPLDFEGMEYDFWRVSFSPSGKYLAVMGEASDILPPHIRTPEFKPNIFILDIEAWLRDPSNKAPVVSAINFYQSFCKFTFAADPVFITDSTLGVSMMGAHDVYQHYYEISIDGQLIRQLSQP